MAIPKFLIATIFLSMLAVHQVLAIETNQLASSTVSKTAYEPSIDCGGSCEARCKLSSRPRLCKRACGTCCARGSCVPPGTAGNYEACPCYANMTTHDKRRKCP